MRLSVINFNTRGLQLRTRQLLQTQNYNVQTITEKPGRQRTEHRWVEKNRMYVRVTERVSEITEYGLTETESTSLRSGPAIIDYEYIVSQVKIEDEQYHERPWDDDEWWSHELKSADRGHFSEIRKATNLIQRRQGLCLIVPDDSSFGGDSVETRCEGFHKRGASKQVAREMVADQTRKWIKQLRSWYTDCVSYFCVECSVNVLNKTYVYDCGGFMRMNNHKEDAEIEEYAKQNAITEVCDQLVEDGFTISNRPEKGTVTYAEACRRCRLHEMRRALQAQNRGTDE